MRQTARTNKEFYVVGGTLKPDAPSYVERQADQELYERVLVGDFCYVLTPRQMGKSSLMARTARRLREQGIRAAIVDLTQIGSEKGKDSADRWYYGIAHRIIRDTGIEANLSEWWQARKNLPALQRLTEFFSDVVLANISDRVVIFIDEIDATIGLEFTDDFFAAIRACHNARASEPEFERLSFVLLGVASPSDLIKDVRRTPFNIGHRIDLTDFTSEEARPLAIGLRANDEESEQALQRVLYWTGGHPYLTQKLCEAVTQEKSESCADADIDRVVEDRFLKPEANREDSNLNFVRDRLVQNKKLSGKLLKLYRRIYRGQTVIDSPRSPVHSALKLTSVVVPSKDRKLHVRNRIYERVFTDEWARKAMPADWNRRIAIASTVVLLLGIGVWYTMLLPRQYINVLQTASEDYQVAFDAYSKLRMIGFVDTANKLLARYWDRRARLAEAQENRDEALLLWLKALSVQATDNRRSEASLLASEDYKNLLMTYRHGNNVTAVAFSPDGKTVLTGSIDATARLWRADTGQPLAQPLRHESVVLAVAFSPDGKTVLTGSRDATARLWSVDTGQPLAQPLRHEDSVQAVAFSPDGKTVITGSNDRTARLWNADTGQLVTQPLVHGYSVQAVAFSPDGKTVITGSIDETAQLWSAETGQPLAQPLRHGSLVWAVAFSPDGKTVLTGGGNGKARLWSVDMGQPVGQPLRHGDWVRAAAFSPDGKTVITGSSDETAQLWSAETGQPLAQPLRHGSLVWAVAFSPDGKIVITGGIDRIARLWSAETGQPVGQPLRHGDSVQAVAFSPDGKTVLTGSRDGTARLWSVDTGEPVAQPLRHGGWVRAAAFSPDGKTVITGSSDETARLWSADTGEPVAQPLRHESVVLAVAFSPDGKTVITGSNDGTVRLWSAETGQPVGQPLRHGNPVLAAAFSSDGKTAMALTSWWAHQFSTDGDNFSLKASRLLSGRQTDAYRFLDDSGDRLQVVSYVTGDSVKIETIQFDSPDASPMPGDPNSLLDEWQKRLALKFDDQGKIVPVWPVESRKELDGNR